MRASRHKLKKKLSKSERSIMQERGKEGVEARGVGVRSRADFSIPA